MEPTDMDENLQRIEELKRMIKQNTVEFETQIQQLQSEIAETISHAQEEHKENQKTLQMLPEYEKRLQEEQYKNQLEKEDEIISHFSDFITSKVIVPTVGFVASILTGDSYYQPYSDTDGVTEVITASFNFWVVASCVYGILGISSTDVDVFRGNGSSDLDGLLGLQIDNDISG